MVRHDPTQKEEEKRMKRMAGIVAIAALGLCMTMAGAEDKPDGTLKLSGGSVAAGVGITWEKGTLSYQGKEWPVDVRGLSVGDVGVTKMEATGEVYNLKKVPDFNGKYVAAGAGAAAGGGATAVVLKNENGVTVKLVSTTQGINIGVGVGGAVMKIR
jgi:hypothetical protein